MNGLDNRTKFILEILSERYRQTAVEGYTLAHDDQHIKGELAILAAAYALSGSERDLLLQNELHHLLKAYHFGDFYKPKDPRRDLIRAGALILAELERLDRVQLREGK